MQGESASLTLSPDPSSLQNSPLLRGRSDSCPPKGMEHPESSRFAFVGSMYGSYLMARSSEPPYRGLALYCRLLLNRDVHSLDWAPLLVLSIFPTRGWQASFYFWTALPACCIRLMTLTYCLSRSPRYPTKLAWPYPAIHYLHLKPGTKYAALLGSHVRRNTTVSEILSRLRKHENKNVK